MAEPRDLNEIKARVEKATKGPWEVELEDDGITSGVTLILHLGDHDGGGWEPQHRIEYEVPSEEESPSQFAEAVANADFIARAIEDVPYLLERLQAIEAERVEQCRLKELANDECREQRSRAEVAEAECGRLRLLATEATNGWACYAKREIEHAEIARLHQALTSTPASPSPKPGDDLKAIGIDVRDQQPDGSFTVVVPDYGLASPSTETQE